MRNKAIFSILILSAVVMTFGFNEAKAAVSLQVGTPNLSFSLSDYQPPPPNVYVHNDRGRPYYVQRDRRVYMEKKHHGKKYKKQHDNRGHGNNHGHDKDRGERRDR